jgi:ribulose-phosphate 3-epimerase
MNESAIEIVPTIVPSSLDNVREVSERYALFASFFQIDVADGKFAPNTTWLPSEGDTLPQEYGYEVHLMVSDPYAIGTLFAEAGAKRLIVHVETLTDVERTREVFERWRKAGVESIGIAILLHTSFALLESYLRHVDFVLLMTIARIGVQGIPYDTSAPRRVAEFGKRHPDVLIAVDGGVSETNIARLARAGARRFGVGSAIAKASDPAAAYQRLLSLAEQALL